MPECSACLCYLVGQGRFLIWATAFLLGGAVAALSEWQAMLAKAAFKFML